MDKKQYKKRATAQAITEAQMIANSPNAKTYSCFDDMLKDISSRKNRSWQLKKCKNLIESI